MNESMSFKQTDIEQVTCCFDEISHSQKEPICSTCKQNMMPVIGKEYLLKCFNCSKFMLLKSETIHPGQTI